MQHISTTKAVLLLLLTGFLLTGLWYGYQMWVGPESDILGPNKYTAVFLTTNEVYFGKVSSMSNEYVVLSDVYYPRVNDTTTTDINQPDILLVKTGNELHGPQDKMFINRDQVTIIQPLRAGSQVVETIASYEDSLVQ